jgi:carboxymethylenebutenolidase
MTVRLHAADGFEFPAYVAQPKGAPKGAIVVLQEIFGVNAHIREVADGYAAQGYLAVAPATFHRAKHGVELGYTPDDMQAGMVLKTAIESLPAPGVLADIQAAVDYAAKTSGAKVGIVGYCWGGSTTDEEVARHAHCPVLAHYAEEDHWIPLETVEKFKHAHPEVEVHLYPANHGFNCDHRGAYQEESAKLALKRTLAFFAKHVG